MTLANQGVLQITILERCKLYLNVFVIIEPYYYTKRVHIFDPKVFGKTQFKA